MATAFDLVTINSPNPDALAEFWRVALALHVTEREDDGRWIVLSDAAGGRRIGLQRGDHRRGGTHLDLRCDPDDFDTELQRLHAIGAHAQAAPRREPYGRIANLCDPDGNEFDLCAYRHEAATDAH